ncbi:hypothetical protein ScPMuIL_010732 [Solemya velum]
MPMYLLLQLGQGLLEIGDYRCADRQCVPYPDNMSSASDSICVACDVSVVPYPDNMSSASGCICVACDVSVPIPSDVIPSDVRMERLGVLRRHLVDLSTPTLPTSSHRTSVRLVPTSDERLSGTGPCTVEVEDAGPGFENCQRDILTPAAIQFVADLVREFSDGVDKILEGRILRKLELQTGNRTPDFLSETEHIRSRDWTVKPVPDKLRCRHVDLGDVSPSNTDKLVAALNSSAQGVQVDFDDGHCPSWSNQMRGLHNVCQVVHGVMPGVPPLKQCPALMLRPRAWNMIEHHMLVDGRQVPGPLFDFGLLMFHNAKLLLDQDCGPFFYLPKLENHMEARLWNDIFLWTEQKLKLPPACTKACVLIENILASFEMDEILYELQDHSAGLNCGIWDYSASFVNKFGHRPDFVLPDRNKYVSMERHFLKSYRDLLVQTCHRRGAHATGGMAAQLLPLGDDSATDILQAVIRSKTQEIQAGVDGFLVYDLRLIQPMKKLFMKLAPGTDQLDQKRLDSHVMAPDLLQIPGGHVTLSGLRHNVMVGVLFIEAWFRGQGHFVLKGAVEDSATAEISRSQVWQWIRHRATVRESGETITVSLVERLVREVERVLVGSLSPFPIFVTQTDRQRLHTATEVFVEIVTTRDFPEFITTYLYRAHTFRAHGHLVQPA